MPLKKTKTLSKLRKEADDWMSKMVRLRDSEPVGLEYQGTCITCSKTGTVAFLDDTTGKLRFTKGWNAGHFVTRGNLITRFVESNVNLQCLTKESNIEMYGNYKRSIKDVIVGDAVIAFDETTHTKTVATVKQNIPLTSKNLFEIKLEDGTIFKGTGDHRVLCEVDGEIDWKYVEDIYNMLHTGTVCNIITS